VAYFQSPSGNIRCMLAADGADGFNIARCDITRWQWQLPPKPADCIFDWGGAVAVMPTGVGAVVCHSDGVLIAQPLAYGESCDAGRSRAPASKQG
jgi:hypothetical protein